MAPLNLTLVAVNPDGYSLGIAFLDAMVRDRPVLQHTVRSVQLLYDLEQVRHPYFDLSTIVVDLLHTTPDVIGLSCYCWNFNICIELASLFHAACPKADLIVGGPEVTMDSEDLLSDLPDGTFLVFGEGEGPLCDLLKSFMGPPCRGIPAGGGVVVGDSLQARPAPRDPLPAHEIPSPLEMGVLQTEGVDWMT